MRSFRRLGDHFDLIPAAINRQLSEIDIARGRQEAFTLQHPAALDSLKQVALIESVEASNAIENIRAPRRRLEALVAETTTPRDRSEAEIAGYRAVLGTIHASAPSIPFTPNVVRQLHRDLYQYSAQPGGDWKSADNLVTEASPDGVVTVRFTPVSAFETPAAIEELHRRFGEAWEADRHHHLLLTAAYALDFLVIHPFTDGNGRMSRLLSLLLLYQGGYEVGRFVSTEKLIDASKETYYEALGQSTRGWHEGARPRAVAVVFSGNPHRGLPSVRAARAGSLCGPWLEGRTRQGVRSRKRQRHVYVRRGEAPSARCERRIHSPGASRASR